MEQVLGQWISEKELGNTHYMKAMRLNIVNQGDIFNGEIIISHKCARPLYCKFFVPYGVDRF